LRLSVTVVEIQLNGFIFAGTHFGALRPTLAHFATAEKHTRAQVHALNFKAQLPSFNEQRRERSARACVCGGGSRVESEAKRMQNAIALGRVPKRAIKGTTVQPL